MPVNAIYIIYSGTVNIYAEKNRKEEHIGLLELIENFDEFCLDDNIYEINTN